MPKGLASPLRTLLFQRVNDDARFPNAALSTSKQSDPDGSQWVHVTDPDPELWAVSLNIGDNGQVRFYNREVAGWFQPEELVDLASEKTREEGVQKILTITHAFQHTPRPKIEE